MNAIKKAFLRVKEDMDKMRREIEQIKDIQGIILDKINVEAATLNMEEMDEELLQNNDDEDGDGENDENEDKEDDDKLSIERNFIATKTGKRYHVLSCNLVKNVAEKNKIFFDSEEDAEEEGLLKCHCVKN